VDTPHGCPLPLLCSTVARRESPADEAIRLPPTQPREVSIDTAVRAGVTGPPVHSMRESVWRGVLVTSTPWNEDARLLRNYEVGTVNWRWLETRQSPNVQKSTANCDVEA
jgi:hypothetical protein